MMSGVQAAEAQSNPQQKGPDDNAEVEDISPPPRSGNRLWVVRLTSIVVTLLAWEFVGRRVNPLFMSYPSAILRAGFAMAQNGELLGALASSLRTLLVGFVCASIIGIIVGLLVGRYKSVDAATDWLVNAMYATPLIAIIPLVILWFGLGDAAKLFIVTLLAVFPVLINTSSGVRNVPR